MDKIKPFLTWLLMVVVGTAVNFIVVLASFAILTALKVPISNTSAGNDSQVLALQYISPLSKFVTFTFYAFPEEFIFRLLPLGFCLGIKQSRRWWIIVAVLSSVFFGLAHGTPEHIFLQGAGGLVYCVLFVVAGGREGRYDKAFATTLFSHALYNTLLFTWF